MWKPLSKRWLDLGISAKIGLSLASLVLGSLCLALAGVLQNHLTHSKLERVTSSLLPATQQSQAAVTAFGEQLKLYEDAIFTGDLPLLTTAEHKGRMVGQALEFLAYQKGLRMFQQTDLLELRDEVAAYTAQATVVYTKMIRAEDEEDENGINDQVLLLAGRADFIRTRLLDNDSFLQQALKNELATVGLLAHKVRNLGMVIFFVVIALAIAMSLFFTKIITRPIVELAASARRIAQGKWSAALVAHGHDEVADLSRSFAGMVTTLRERTEALEAANKELNIEIDERRQTQEALKKSEQKYREIFNATNEAIIIYHSKSGKILDFNQSVCSLSGYTPAEVMNLQVADFSAGEHPYTGQELTRLFKQTIEEGPQFFNWHACKKDGELVWVEISLNVSSIRGKDVIILVARDISDRMEAEEELRQAQKMEAIGTLAGGIAHDFNNILSAIFGFTELAKRHISKPDKLSEDLAEVHKGAIRARDLVQQILTFCRKTEEERLPLQMSLIVKEALKLLRSSIPTSIEIKQSIETQGMVLADPTQIHQVMMNLCTNAYHAMRETGGTLAVSLKEVEITAGDYIPELELAPGNYLQLQISDTGCGIEKETVEKIFDPYFTTKEMGEGTGLGLAVVHGIVKSYEGHIKVYSEPGKGTTFNIYLPEVKKEQGEYKPATEEEPVKGGNERIMVVDDEQAIVNVAKLVFTDYGYSVNTFPDGVQALHEFKEHPDHYDLVITDMAMPYMEGTELAQKLLEIRPDIPVILNTGFSERVNKEKAEAMGIKEFVQKPVNLNNLLRATRKVLDSLD